MGGYPVLSPYVSIIIEATDNITTIDKLVVTLIKLSKEKILLY